MPYVRTVTLDQFAGIVRALPGELEQAVIRGLRSAAQRGVGIVVQEIDSAQPYPAVDRGELRQSVAATDIDRGARIHVDAPHAIYIELGTRPHWPPIAPLAEWALRKGIADDQDEAEEIAFAIAKQISVEGTIPRFFMKKAMQKLELIIPGEVQRELEAI